MPLGYDDRGKVLINEGSVLLAMSKAYLLVVVILVVTFSTSVIAEISVEQGYVRGLPPGQPNTAAFMRLVNQSDESITIDRAVSASAKLAEFHSHRHNDGLMRMVKEDSIIIPAGGEFVLKPGEYHLMLMDLVKPLREGDEVALTLYTTDGEAISMQLPVRSVLNEHKHHH